MKWCVAIKTAVELYLDALHRTAYNSLLTGKNLKKRSCPRLRL
jgi:hypothetical protein